MCYRFCKQTSIVLIKSLDIAVNIFDKRILLGDFNINILGNEKTSVIIVNIATCLKSARGTVIDIKLTNRPNSFKYACAITTGLSHCLMLIRYLALDRVQLKRLTLKEVT